MQAPVPMRHRVFGCVILLALLAHVVVKIQTHLVSEVLWSCHVFSCALGVGLLVGSWPLAAVGFLYHLAMGMPAYLIDLAAGASTNVTGVVTHVASLFLGIAAAWSQPLARRVIFQTWAAYALLLPVTMLLADPALNVNQVTRPWLPMPGIFGLKAVYLSLNLVCAAIALIIAREAWVRARKADRKTA